MENESNLYPVKDLYLAAFLYSRGLVLEKVTREGTTCWFAFKDKHTAENLSDLYWKGQGSLNNVKLYSDGIRTLKDLIFAQR